MDAIKKIIGVLDREIAALEEDVLYTDTDLDRIMSAPEKTAFKKYVVGQTVSTREGQMAYYTWEIKDFLNLYRNGQSSYWKGEVNNEENR